MQDGRRLSGVEIINPFAPNAKARLARFLEVLSLRDQSGCAIVGNDERNGRVRPGKARTPVAVPAGSGI